MPVTAHCQRTQATIRCYADALTLKLFYSIIFKCDEREQEIQLPDLGTFGPLVQHVSKNIMTVKY